MGYCDFGQVTNFKDGTQLLEDTQVIPAPTPSDTIRVIEVDDHLPLLAEEIYNDPDYWFKVAAFNDIVNPFELEVGSTLILPTHE